MRVTTLQDTVKSTLCALLYLIITQNPITQRTVIKLTDIRKLRFGEFIEFAPVTSAVSNESGLHPILNPHSWLLCLMPLAKLYCHPLSSPFLSYPTACFQCNVYSILLYFAFPLPPDFFTDIEKVNLLNQRWWPLWSFTHDLCSSKLEGKNFRCEFI